MKVKRKKRLMHCPSPDSFSYNNRSELSSASLGVSPYAYDYDNIGNRKTAQEITEEISYDANNINQYSSITQGETPFVPIFDADGNQSLIQSSTGIWAVSYNAESRPIIFTRTEAEQTTIIECGYDYMGRRYMKQVSVNGVISLHQRYLYRGYLQIACVDLTRGGQPALWLSMWDPTELVATRPLAIQKNATWYSYGHDLTKNVTELYHTNGTISTTYDYTPFGVVTATGTEQPYQWSSEYHDTELGLVYYNYRHYNPRDGRWINRDPIAEQGGLNLYGFVGNANLFSFDSLGEKKETYNAEMAIGIPLGIPLLVVAGVEVSYEKMKSCTCLSGNIYAEVGLGAGIGVKFKGNLFGLAANIEANIRAMVIGARRRQMISGNNCNGNYNLHAKSDIIGLTHNISFGVSLFTLSATITIDFSIAIGYEFKMNRGSASISVFSEGHLKINGTLGFPWVKPIEKMEIAHQNFKESKTIWSI